VILQGEAMELKREVIKGEEGIGRQQNGMK
jgi:hypothetical protein